MRPGELAAAYAGRRVLVTGHTGFKGAWLTLWLRRLGASVTGYALPPAEPDGLFVAAGVEALCEHRIADVRDRLSLLDAIRAARPEVVFHLAAQSLVRRSHAEPLETVETNVLGTCNLLEAVRRHAGPCAVVAVTSDKCYENREWPWGYREDEPMGGHDVYSASKGAMEVLVASWRRSFFPPARLGEHGVALATARAGNVIGGGDRAADRIVPDVVRALGAGVPVAVRNPDSVRPWQHVLEPVGGYLLLGARLLGAGTGTPGSFCEAWNFGPDLGDARPVRDLVEAAIRAWGSGSWEHRPDPAGPREAGVLRLAIEKAATRLGWRPRWSFEEAVEASVAWYREQAAGTGPAALRALAERQIAAYEASS